MLKGWLVCIVFCCGLCAARQNAHAALTADKAVQEELAWPEITRACKPWAISWWPGSAADAQSISNEFRRYAEGGLGGVNIVPIYGVKGMEDRFVDYLTPAWMELFATAAREAERNGLGLDMTTGSGWCFGGAHISQEKGGWRHGVEVYTLDRGQSLTNRFVKQGVQCLQAVAADGVTEDLLPQLDAQGQLINWRAEQDGMRVIALTVDCSKGQRVKRAGPGGAGLMINPFDPSAMEQFLAPFTEAFPVAGKGQRPRAMYHDSYEYYGCSWCEDFLNAFARKRGYRLENELAAFAGVGDPARSLRVKADYRETLSDLIVEDVFPKWCEWCRSRGIGTRIQAHGAPANLLDFYALATIPETEMFGHGGKDPLVSRYDADFGKADRNPFISKLASSAAHVKGLQRVSAEFGTWLAEHFHETPEEIKCLADLMFVSGMNHLFYHGTCFSADDAAWPGWLFYAATQMNPRNPIWHDVPLLNNYIARTQSILQSGKPSNDVLLYWPIHDLWAEEGPYLRRLTVHDSEWIMNQPLGRTSESLWRLGYGFDYVSDRLLSGLKVAEGQLVTAEGAVYRALMIPSCELMPPKTFEKMLEFAQAGVPVIFCGDLPKDVPGWGGLEQRRARFAAAKAPLVFKKTEVKGVLKGEGRAEKIYVGRGDAALKLCGVRRELKGAPDGVRFIRRRHARGYHYLIVNHSMQVLDGWVQLAAPASSVVALDAMHGATGVAQTRLSQSGAMEVRLYLEPAGSVLLRTFDRETVRGAPFRFARPGEPAIEITAPWQVEFIAGGPVLPAAYETPVAASWTKNGDQATARFSGTAVYRTSFDAPDDMANKPVILDLGRVEVSARVRLNSKPVGHALMTPYRVPLPQGVRAGHNELEVEVTNLGANRIRDLDIREVPWRIFHDINFISIQPKKFDASQWPVRESGLLGPVKILERKD